MSKAEYTADAVHFMLGRRRLRPVDHQPVEAPDYTRSARAPMHGFFHWPEVPADVVAYNDSLLVDVPSCIGLDSIRPRIVAEEAARIDVPVYIGLAECDNSPDPHAEPGFYRASRDVTLHVQPRSGHCHTFAGTRRALWIAWIAGRPASRRCLR
jgi:hypothetical protein